MNVLREPDYSKEINNPFLYGKPLGNKISRHNKADKDGKIEILDKEKSITIIYENDKNLAGGYFITAMLMNLFV